MSTYPPDRPVPGTSFSSDGKWWWDGRQWFPAVTADLKWWFDGTSWRPANKRIRPPKWVWVTGIIWALALGIWLLAAAAFVATALPGDPGPPAVGVVLTLAGIAALGTLVWGFFLGRERQTRWIWFAALIGTAVELFGYASVMLAAPNADGNDQDTAAAAGAVIVSIPTMLLILALLWTGAGLGILSRKARSRRTRL